MALFVVLLGVCYFLTTHTLYHMPHKIAIGNMANATNCNATAIHLCETGVLTLCDVRYILKGMKQYTSAEMAQLTGKARRTVLKAAETAAETGNSIGRKIGRDWVFTDADIAKIKKAVGSPRVRPRRVSAVVVAYPDPQP